MKKIIWLNVTLKAQFFLIFLNFTLIEVSILKFVSSFKQCITPATASAAADVGHKAWK